MHETFNRVLFFAEEFLWLRSIAPFQIPSFIKCVCISMHSLTQTPSFWVSKITGGPSFRLLFSIFVFIYVDFVFFWCCQWTTTKTQLKGREKCVRKHLNSINNQVSPVNLCCYETDRYAHKSFTRYIRFGNHQALSAMWIVCQSLCVSLSFSCFPLNFLLTDYINLNAP